MQYSKVRVRAPTDTKASTEQEQHKDKEHTHQSATDAAVTAFSADTDPEPATNAAVATFPADTEPKTADQLNPCQQRPCKSTTTPCFLFTGSQVTQSFSVSRANLEPRFDTAAQRLVQRYCELLCCSFRHSSSPPLLVLLGRRRGRDQKDRIRYWNNAR